MGNRPVGVTDVADAGDVANYRTRERTISAVEQVEQYLIPLRQEPVSVGVYRVQSFFIAANNAHVADTAAFFWLVNTSADAVVVVRAIEFRVTYNASTAGILSPRVGLLLATFTGTPTGASIEPTRRVSTAQNGTTADAAPVGSFRTAITGLAVTEAETFHAFVMGTNMSTIGSARTSGLNQNYLPNSPDGRITLAQNEAIVCKQLDTGSTSKQFTVNVVWEEVTLP